jgi:hypothetical protein
VKNSAVSKNDEMSLFRDDFEVLAKRRTVGYGNLLSQAVMSNIACLKFFICPAYRINICVPESIPWQLWNVSSTIPQVIAEMLPYRDIRQADVRASDGGCWSSKG